MRFIAFALAVVAGSVAACAQPLSPPADTSVTINGKKITVNYSAPSMRGRKIVGGLVPYGAVWRTGANAATSLKTEGNLTMDGLKVPKGDYTLYTFVDPSQWLLIVNKQTGQDGTDYDQGQDLGRVKMTMGKSPSPVEKFTITLTGTGGNKGLLKLAWENTVASVAFTVD